MKKSSTPPQVEPAPCLHDWPTAVPELDLPEGRDFISRRTPMSLERALPLLEERRRWFPLTPAMREARSRRRVTAEFIL